MFRLDFSDLAHKSTEFQDYFSSSVREDVCKYVRVWDARSVKGKHWTGKGFLFLCSWKIWGKALSSQASKKELKFTF